MSATCPACGVPVVPGYVRCPKCQRALPQARVRTIAGGTAVEGGGGLPILPLAGGAIVVLGIILYFVLGKSDAAKPANPDPATTTAEEPVAADVPSDPPSNNMPTPLPVEPDRGGDPNRIDPNAVVKDLERALKNQRLWSSVHIVDKDIEVTSGSCRDAGMLPTVAAASTALRNAGLTRVRCLENSGAVVFERGL